VQQPFVPTISMLRMLSIAQKTLAAVGGLTVAGAAAMGAHLLPRTPNTVHNLQEVVAF
jgi:hypothetical protein